MIHLKHKNLFLLGCLAQVSFGCAFAQGLTINASNVPDEVKPFIQNGYDVLFYKSIDMDGDGDLDGLLVLEKQTINPQPLTKAQRPLLILERHAGNSLKLAARNDNIIQCSRCGGSKDPLSLTDGFKFGIKWFSVSQDSFAGNTNNSTYTFKKYANGRWYLKQFENNHTVNTKMGIDVITKVRSYPKHFSKISFNRFNPVSFAKQYNLNR